MHAGSRQPNCSCRFASAAFGIRLYKRRRSQRGGDSSIMYEASSVGAAGNIKVSSVWKQQQHGQKGQWAYTPVINLPRTKGRDETTWSSIVIRRSWSLIVLRYIGPYHSVKPNGNPEIDRMCVSRSIMIPSDDELGGQLLAHFQTKLEKEGESKDQLRLPRNCLHKCPNMGVYIDPFVTRYRGRMVAAPIDHPPTGHHKCFPFFMCCNNIS